jgi:hypothetical protein
MTGRTALGVLCVVAAVLGIALFLQRAQNLTPVYAANRDLASGTVLAEGDLRVVRVRLPGDELQSYLQPHAGQPYAGRVLATALRQGLLVPAETVVNTTATDQVEAPIKVDAGDMAEGLRPGDLVQVLAAFTDGSRAGQAKTLLPSAEVVRVLKDPTAFGGDGQDTGVQVRMPAADAEAVAAAVANARIFIVKAPPVATNQTVPAP